MHDDPVHIPDTPAELLAAADHVDLVVTDPLARVQQTANWACTLAIVALCVGVYLYFTRSTP
jgi:hypothetical protein